MFTHKDIEYRSLFVIDCLKEKTLRVCNGELLLENKEDCKTLTKLPFQKILALFIIGHIHITTPLIDKCRKYNVALIVVSPSLRPVFFWALSAEGNFLLRQKQYSYEKDNLSIAGHLVWNKIKNQWSNLKNTRCKDEQTLKTMDRCYSILNSEILKNCNYTQLLSIEGNISKICFETYFRDFNWQGRKPRLKRDMINCALDIGYTILFNYIEVFVRMFGFDPYIGVYHRLWFKRKSLICDLVEPFRCIIDKTVRKGIRLKQIKESDFRIYKGEYRLKVENNTAYCSLFYGELLKYKTEVFRYIQSYYRCFMQNKAIKFYPLFEL